MSAQIFEAALGLTPPWFIADLEFEGVAKRRTIRVDFRRGSRFQIADFAGEHPVHDTVTKRYRHLNFSQHECFLEVRVPRVELPDGSVRLVQPDWAGKLSGFTLLFEALVLMLAQQMPFRAVGRIVGLSPHRVMAFCERYVDLARAEADLSEVRSLAIDETSRAREHDYLTLATDAELADELTAHGADLNAIDSCSIDMLPAFIRGVTDHLPNASITVDKFHVIARASEALDRMRRLEQGARQELQALVGRLTTLRTARAWQYREQLRAILQRKQVNVVRQMLRQWCTNVMRSEVDPMKAVAKMIRRHLDGIVAWVKTRQTNGFLDAINGLFQAAKRKARGYTRLSTARTVTFLLSGKLGFCSINPHVYA